MNNKDIKLPYIFDIGGTTWRILLALVVKREPSGPRELARQLKMSSHSLAVYHLNKLIELDLVEKTVHGDYQVNPIANLNFLNEIIFFKQKAIPYLQIICAAVFTSLFFIYLLIVGFDESIQSVFALTISMTAALLFSFEAYHTWQLSGFLNMDS